jgi:hypothetical protein
MRLEAERGVGAAFPASPFFARNDSDTYQQNSNTELGLSRQGQTNLETFVLKQRAGWDDWSCPTNSNHLTNSKGRRGTTANQVSVTTPPVGMRLPTWSMGCMLHPEPPIALCNDSTFESGCKDFTDVSGKLRPAGLNAAEKVRGIRFGWPPILGLTTRPFRNRSNPINGLLATTCLGTTCIDRKGSACYWGRIYEGKGPWSHKSVQL